MFMNVLEIIITVLAEVCFLGGIFFLSMLLIIIVDAVLYARRFKKNEKEIEEYTRLKRLSGYKNKEGEWYEFNCVSWLLYDISDFMC